MGLSVSKFAIIPEDVLKDSADALMDSDQDNSFIVCYRAGQAFRDADMTPLYLLEVDTMKISVYAKETFMKKLH